MLIQFASLCRVMLVRLRKTYITTDITKHSTMHRNRLHVHKTQTCNTCTTRHYTIPAHSLTTSRITNQTTPMHTQEINSIQQQQIYYTHQDTQESHTSSHQTKHIHTTTVTTYLNNRKLNKLLHTAAPTINTTEATLTIKHNVRQM